MASNWTNELILEFIELYGREDILWDTKNHAHKNRNENAEAWERIREALGNNFSVVELKKKKESLMSTFRLHMTRKKKIPNYHCSWFAFPLMETYLGARYHGEYTDLDSSEVFYDSGQTHTFTYMEKGVSDNLKTEKKQLKHKSPEYLYVKKQKDYPYCPKNVEVKKEMDECDLYTQLLAKKLRKLDEHYRDVAMHEIDNIIFRIKMQQKDMAPGSYSITAVQKGGQSPVFISTNTNEGEFESDSMLLEKTE